MAVKGKDDCELPRFKGRESKAGKFARANEIIARLGKLYPGTTTALHWKTPFQLLVATILSAQCTDERVNKVTPPLFKRWPTAKKMSAANLNDIEEMVRSTGFYRNKAKNIQASARLIEEKFKGEVPQTMEQLLILPGVARKTANCVMGTAFNKPVGVVVDTHVGRLSRRIGLSLAKDPVKVELDLMKLFKQSGWTRISHLLIDHGRAVCSARRAPTCEGCFLADLCRQRL